MYWYLVFRGSTCDEVIRRNNKKGGGNKEIDPFTVIGGEIKYEKGGFEK